MLSLLFYTIHSVHKVESKGILKGYRREEQKKSKKLVQTLWIDPANNYFLLPFSHVTLLHSLLKWIQLILKLTKPERLQAFQNQAFLQIILFCSLYVTPTSHILSSLSQTHLVRCSCNWLLSNGANPLNTDFCFLLSPICVSLLYLQPQLFRKQTSEKGRRGKRQTDYVLSLLEKMLMPNQQQVNIYRCGHVFVKLS